MRVLLTGSAGFIGTAIGAALEPVFAAFAAERHPGESFGDFTWRLGQDRLLALTSAVVAA